VAAPFTLLGLDHIVLRVKALQPMLHFYTVVLGGTLERQQEELGLYQVRTGATLVDLVPLDGKLGRAGGAGPGREGRNLDHFALRIEPYDEDAIRTHLRSHGIEPGESGSRYGAEGEGPSIYLADPEGNLLELKGPPRGP
jgi:glyoxylase I family protein